MQEAITEIEMVGVVVDVIIEEVIEVAADVTIVGIQIGDETTSKEFYILIILIYFIILDMGLLYEQIIVF